MTVPKFKTAKMVNMRCMKTICHIITSFIFTFLFLLGSASADPIDNWILRDSKTDKSLLGITYGGSEFVAVGEDGTYVTSS